MTKLIGDVGAGFAGLDLEIEGVEYLNDHKPAIYIFNHRSLMDAMAMAHLLQEDVVGLCKKELAV